MMCERKILVVDDEVDLLQMIETMKQECIICL